MTAVALAFATVLGVGYAPVAPGTFGSAAGLLVWWLLPSSPAIQIGAIVAIFIVGSWSGSVAEKHFGRTDPGQVVIDEVMGMLITLLFNPVGWMGATLGFLLFRVADIVKPYPANRLERLHGGIGVMADDGMAAIYANLALRLLIWHRAAWIQVMKACIIAVGSEMLTPFRVDTNSLFITERLNEIGIDVRFKAVVGDDVGELADVLERALAWADLIVITGGLGPTEDDLTRDAVARALTLALDVDEAIVDRIRERFARRGMTMPDINRRQAMVPRGAVVLANANGTAPGLWIEHERTGLLLLPGPPREMIPILDAVVAERLAPRSAGAGLFRRVLRITGRAESDVDARAQPIYGAMAEAAGAD